MPRILDKLVDFRSGEGVPAVLGTLCFFCLLFSYSLLRPLREAFGLERGEDSLRLLFLATLVAMTVVSVAYGWLVKTLPRRIFVPLVYRLAILSLAAFLALLLWKGEGVSRWVGSVFYVWLSVFNVLAVSVFWALMADSFSLEQGKRLFGFVGVGGTAGAIVGSSTTWQLAEHIGPVGLMLVAMVLIEFAAQLAGALNRRSARGIDAPLNDRRIGGSAWAGLGHMMRSPFLAGIALYVLLYTVGSTLLYFEKMRIVASAVEGRDERTSVFAAIELAGQSMTIILQVFLTGRLMKWLGVGALLAAMPLVSLIGFGALWVWPTLAVVTLFEAARRASNFALSKPARETLFTVVPRDDKYKAKAVIDTVVYRGGDTVGTLVDKVVAMAMASVAVVALPLSAGSLVLGFWLGGRVRSAGSSTGTSPGAGTETRA